MIRTALLIAAQATPYGVVVAAEGGGSDLPPWLQYGVLGLVIVALVITKQLVPGWVHQEVRIENRELKAEIRELVRQNFDTQRTVLPVLEKATGAIEEAMRERRTTRES